MLNSDASIATVTEREIIITRLIDAPRALVFRVWTDEKHLDQWWGPNGFKNSTRKMEFKPGGRWVYTMHGPDGTDYPNWVQYHKIIPNEYLEYSHGGAEDAPAEFETTVTFAEEAGKTRITMRALFPTAEILQHLIAAVGAVEGGKETIARLDEYVQSLKSAA